MNLELLLLVGVVHLDHEHEAVELRLGERVGSLLFDRVLGREHEERLGERVILAPHRDLALLHRLQHRGLRLRRRPVDLVRQDDVGEDRAGQKLELALVGGRVGIDHLRAGDVARHQVGRELDPLEGEVEGFGQARNEERLGQTRHAHQERMAPREDRNHDLVDHLILADDDLRDLAADPLDGLFEAGNGLEVLRDWGFCAHEEGVTGPEAPSFRRNRQAGAFEESHRITG